MVRNGPSYSQPQLWLLRLTNDLLGGYLGIPCTHAYPHTIEESIPSLPAALKGVDMAVYETFRAIGLEISMRPILDVSHTIMEDMRQQAEWDADKDFTWPCHGGKYRELYNNFTEPDDIDCIGSELRPIQTAGIGEDTALHHIVEAWGSHELGKVNWLVNYELRTMLKKQPALAYIAVSNILTTSLLP